MKYNFFTNFFCTSAKRTFCVSDFHIVEPKLMVINDNCVYKL